MSPSRSSALWIAAVVVLGCSSTPSVPEANRALRETPLTARGDLEAYEEADAAHDRLNAWCEDAVALRENGEELSADDPVLSPEADAEVEGLRRAAERATSEELRSVLAQLSGAHMRRLEVLRRPGKHAAKKYLRTERKVVELGFGLRRWRNQR